MFSHFSINCQIKGFHVYKEPAVGILQQIIEIEQAVEKKWKNIKESFQSFTSSNCNYHTTLHLQAHCRLVIWLLNDFPRYKFCHLMHFIKAFRLCDKIADNGEDTLKIWEKATGNMYLHKIRQRHRLIKRNKNNRFHN